MSEVNEARDRECMGESRLCELDDASGSVKVSQGRI